VEAEITHQEPDSHIAWRSIEGKENAGDVRFDSLGDDRTRIQVVMTWEPEGFVEATAEKIGRDDAAVKADLERFKELVEGRGVESGAWRGQVVEVDRRQKRRSCRQAPVAHAQPRLDCGHNNIAS
jgi:uncharacterized membrane protein